MVALAILHVDLLRFVLEFMGKIGCLSSVLSEDSPVTVTTVYVLCIYSLAILDTTHLELCEQERILEYSLDRFDEVRLQRSGVLLLGVTRHQELLQRLVTFV